MVNILDMQLERECLDFNSINVIAVAGALGKETLGVSFGPCPVCSKHIRHRKSNNPTLACGVYRGSSWTCFSDDCMKSRGICDLVAYSRYQAAYRDLATEERTSVICFLEQFATTNTQIITEQDVEDLYPNKDAYKIWAAASYRPIPTVVGYLASRGIDVREPVIERHVKYKGEEVLIPLYDDRNYLSSLIFRSTDIYAKTKSKGMRGVRKKLAMTCERFRRGVYTSLIIVEGEIDFLSALLARPEGGAVMGVIQGSWCPEWESLITCPVVIATDHDKAGDKYANTILKSFPTATRWVSDIDPAWDYNQDWSYKCLK